ncbi:MAG: phosphopantetheine-binding protein, partial [Cypionkella sp.]|nr:phosphopantetheine-binding protein [Cypionkella sp.]
MRAEGAAFDRPDLDSAYVEPTNDVERTLVGFWQELLGVGKVGVEDSFFDLGGHSLIAVRLFAMVKKAFRVDFPISVLFEAPTIAACARLIIDQIGLPESAEGGAVVAARSVAPVRRFTHLVPMHRGEGGARRPFFLVAGMFGNVLNLRHLA